MLNIVQEHFTSIHRMLNTIKDRKNNFVMNRKNDSNEASKKFAGTASYEEAVELFQNGYTEILPKIKKGLAENVNASSIETRRRIRTGVIGYAPHVPNAILNLPNSMILTESQPQKIKAVSILYNPTANCFTQAEEFITSGIAVLSAINILEMSGIRVNLKIAFYFAEQGNDRAVATVDVKDYREHVDIQKLCFPIAHPSMLRRFGFKWLETVEGLKEVGWSLGYGAQMEKGTSEFVKNNEYFINLESTKKVKYDPHELIKSLNIK